MLPTDGACNATLWPFLNRKLWADIVIQTHSLALCLQCHRTQVPLDFGANPFPPSGRQDWGPPCSDPFGGSAGFTPFVAATGVGPAVGSRSVLQATQLFLLLAQCACPQGHVHDTGTIFPFAFCIIRMCPFAAFWGAGSPFLFFLFFGSPLTP